jgi:tetratricopeptide (TPR) repeat protein
MPVVAAVILFFAIVNLVNEKQNLNIILFSLLIGMVIGAVISALASFGVYLLPFEPTRNEFFNTLGSPIQMIGFIIPLIILTLGSFLFKYKKLGKESLKKIPVIFYAIIFLLFSITIGLVTYQITSAPETPVLLPFEHGFQLSLAQISQDSQRLLPSFLFGSGYGTFSNVFTKFHLASFNALPSWNLTFSFSSSYALELVATTGILGFLTYIFMIIRFFRSHGRVVRPLFLATSSLFVLSFILPFSYALVALLFILLALYTVNLRLKSSSKSIDEIVISLETKGRILEFNETNSRKGDMLLPLILTISSLGFIVYSLFFLISREGFGPRGLYHYALSDITFAKALQPEALASGQQTYDLQIEAIQTYPYRADFYRIFAQVNLALATNLVNSQADAPTVTEEVQTAIIQQLQQAINASRQAVIFAPESSLNWRSLGQVYRNLIGVGQDAEQFAIASYNQAIVLEPNNPALYIELGGIYYQLQEFDLAQNQFQVAVSLKRNYANAYYNLGHALEEKGQLVVALQQYQIVRQLVQNDPQSLELIDEEISALQKRIGQAEAGTTPEENLEPTDETGLELQDQGPQFPERDPREEIPAPPVSGEEETTPTPTPTE